MLRDSGISLEYSLIVFMTYVNNKGRDQSVNPHSLIITYAILRIYYMSRIT